MYASPLLVLPVLFIDKEIWQKTRPFFLFIFTGTLESIERNLAKEKVRALGGQTSESVSQIVDFVVVGKEPGSKLDKAKKLGLRIIGEKEFLGLIRLVK